MEVKNNISVRDGRHKGRHGDKRRDRSCVWDVILPLGDFCELRVSIPIPPCSSVPKGDEIPLIIEGSLPKPRSPHGRVMGRMDRDVKPPRSSPAAACRDNFGGHLAH